MFIFGEWAYLEGPVAMLILAVLSTQGWFTAFIHKMSLYLTQLIEDT